jgi:hypothetical protein
MEPGVGVEPTLAALRVYYGLLRGVSAARRLIRSALGGQANPGLVLAPGENRLRVASGISLMTQLWTTWAVNGH